jgi:ABC-2 type transport system ATP-binding protein
VKKDNRENEMTMENMEADGIIDLDQVSLSFGQEVGVYDLDYSVQKGTIFGLIGPSGCGKTTSIRVMLGLFPPDKGKVNILGKDSRYLTRPLREQIGYLPQHFVLYPELTVNENLRFVASLYGIGLTKRQKRIDEMLTLVELKDEGRRLAKDLSGGMRKRLELAAALLHQPQLLFADEPTAGIDPVLRGKLWEYINRYREAGNTLFITTQYVDEATYFDLVGIMFEGRMIHIDSPVNLRRLAMGGDAIAMTLDPEHVDKSLVLLKDQPGIIHAMRDEDRFNLIRLTVDDSGKRMPEIFELIKQHPEIKVYHADSYDLPFDTVFRILIEKERENSGV